MSYADLHVHSVHSDGQLTVKEIIKHSIRLNMKAISITDHDTISGTAEALKYKDIFGNQLEIIEGIEFSTNYQGAEVHVLGYMYDLNNENLKLLSERLQNSRLDRAIKMVEKFNSIGIIMTVDEILQESGGRSIGRPHFARFLKKRGYVKSEKEAFDKYIAVRKPCYIKRYHLSTQEAIETIKQAKGVPVLAHPGLISRQRIIREIINLGIVGIEVYHPTHTSIQEEEYYKLACDNDLLITGGSDCHSRIPEEEPFIGSVNIPYTRVIDLKNYKNRAYNQI